MGVTLEVTPIFLAEYSHKLIRDNASLFDYWAIKFRG